MCVIILQLSFAPPSAFHRIPTFPNEDKLVHFLLYLALTVLLILDTERSSRSHHINHKQVLGVCLWFAIILGGAVEIMQPLFFAPRTASWFDWLADCLGILAGWYLIKSIFNKMNIRFFEQNNSLNS